MYTPKENHTLISMKGSAQPKPISQLKTQFCSYHKSGDARPWLGLDGVVLALTSILFLVLSTGSGETYTDDSDSSRRRHIRRRLQILSSIPAALIVFLIGILLCFLRDPSVISDLNFGPSRICPLEITWSDMKTGFIQATVPQIPLSVLNFVIAFCKLSADLFPGKEVSAMAVSVSVGPMNLVGCWFPISPDCNEEE